MSTRFPFAPTRVRPVWLLALAAIAFCRAVGQDLAAASERARADLEAALAELTRVNEAIASEKIPLARRLAELEDQVIAGRRELEKVRRTQENQLVELNVLKADVKRRSDAAAFRTSLLGEYARLFETRIHIAEVARHAGVVGAAKVAAEAGTTDPEARLADQGRLLQEAAARLDRVLGGEVFEGRALAPRGVMEDGKVVLVGPVALFRSGASDLGGLVQLQLGSPEPSVIPLEPGVSGGIAALAASGAGMLPLDPSLGNALKIAATKDTFLQHFRKGGPVMYPIAALGLAAILVALVKWAQLSRIRLATPMDLQAVLGHLRRDDAAAATAHAGKIPGPTGDLLRAAVEHADEKKEYIEEVLYEVMLNVKPGLERLLPFLTLTAASAPLLGLLGTVTGIINTFGLISVFGTGDPKTLSSGISEALITTEYGLLVAIPALIVQALLSRRVKGVLGSMEQLTVGFINGLPDRVGLEVR